MFSTAESAEISDRYVSVRILGGDDLTPAKEKVLRRYGVGGYPSLLAVTASGGLVDGDLLSEGYPGVGTILEAMKAAEGANAEFLAERDRLAKKTDVEGLLALATLLEGRRELSSARVLYEKLVAHEDAAAETYVRLLGVLRAESDTEAEEALLEKAIERFPEHEDHTGWRMRLATRDVQEPRSQAEVEPFLDAYAEALGTLLTQLAAEKNTAAEAVVRVRLAMVEADRGDDETANAHLDWIFENAIDTPGALDAKLLQIRQAMSRREPEAVKEHATWIVEHGPKSRQAAHAHRQLGELAFMEEDLDTAAAHFQAIIDIDPDAPAAAQAREAIKAIAEMQARAPAPVPEDDNEKVPEDDAGGMDDDG